MIDSELLVFGFYPRKFSTWCVSMRWITFKRMIRKQIRCHFIIQIANGHWQRPLTLANVQLANIWAFRLFVLPKVQSNCSVYLAMELCEMLSANPSNAIPYLHNGETASRENGLVDIRNALAHPPGSAIAVTRATDLLSFSRHSNHTHFPCAHQSEM